MPFVFLLWSPSLLQGISLGWAMGYRNTQRRQRELYHSDILVFVFRFPNYYDYYSGVKISS